MTEINPYMNFMKTIPAIYQKRNYIKQCSNYRHSNRPIPQHKHCYHDQRIQYNSGNIYQLLNNNIIVRNFLKSSNVIALSNKTSTLK